MIQCGGTYYPSTLEKAKVMGLTPCNKCAKSKPLLNKWFDQPLEGVLLANPLKGDTEGLTSHYYSGQPLQVAVSFCLILSCYP